MTDPQWVKEEKALNESEVITSGYRLDSLGAAASLSCAEHCAAMLLQIGLMPVVGLGFLAEEQTERALAGLYSGCERTGIFRK